MGVGFQNKLKKWLFGDPPLPAVELPFWQKINSLYHCNTMFSKHCLYICMFITSIWDLAFQTNKLQPQGRIYVISQPFPFLACIQFYTSVHKARSNILQIMIPKLEIMYTFFLQSFSEVIKLDSYKSIPTKSIHKVCITR